MFIVPTTSFIYIQRRRRRRRRHECEMSFCKQWMAYVQRQIRCAHIKRMQYILCVFHSRLRQYIDTTQRIEKKNV